MDSLVRGGGKEIVVDAKIGPITLEAIALFQNHVKRPGKSIRPGWNCQPCRPLQRREPDLAHDLHDGLAQPTAEALDRQ
jgi:hypothetical protein